MPFFGSVSDVTDEAYAFDQRQALNWFQTTCLTSGAQPGFRVNIEC